MPEAVAAINPVGKLGVSIGGFEALFSASPVVQLTLILLITLSVLCWTVILLKKKQISKLTLANGEFAREFWAARSLDQIFERIDQFPQSNLAKVFRAGYLEIQKIAGSKLADKGETTEGFKLSGIENLERTLHGAVEGEILDIERYLTILATTGSTGPFIGLFGTVWGIMGSFQKIGQTGAASLAVVAPGISEALIATAIGLAAAIPAVVAYNYFLSQVKRQELSLNNFASDFLNIAKRNFFTR